MRDGSTSFGAFLAELKRRHVFRTLLGYGAVAFVVLQTAEIVLPAFGVGDWVLQLIVVLAVLGLPIVLALAWVYEITPRGIRTMKELDLEAGRKLEEEGSLFPRVALLVVTVLAAGAAGAYWIRTAVPTAEAGATDPAARAASPAFRPADDAAANVPIRSLAVLPLESFSPPSATEGGAAEGGYFAAGMHEAIISRLSRTASSFRVISRTTVQQFDPTGLSVAQVGEALGVEGIVEGSVVLDGDRVRITVQLIHAPSDTHLWSADYERQLGDVIALQREVGDAIAAAIMGELEQGPTLTPPEAVASAAAREVDPDAAMAEMRGRVALSGAAEGDDHGVAEARRHFERALREDSTYAPALVGLAGSTLMRGLSDGRVLSDEMLATVTRQVERALELDPTSDEARDILAVVHRMHPGPEGAAPAPPRSPRVDDEVTIRTDLGARISALSASQFARDSVPAIRLEAARSLMSVGRMDDAARLLAKTARSHPGHAASLDELEHVLVVTGRLDEAVATRRSRPARATVPGGPSPADLEEAVASKGARGYWEWRLAELSALDRAGRGPSPLARARVLAALGRPGPAFAALAEARGDASGLATLRSDPVWDPYRADPRFRAIVHDVMGAPPGV